MGTGAGFLYRPTWQLEVSASVDGEGKRVPAQVFNALTDLARSGLPGAQAVLSGPDGHHTATGGAGNLRSGAPYADGAHIRIGSVTQTFVATVVLQLVAEGAVDLDAPIELYLPDVVWGTGNDGNRVTVRQLLQHTSGLPDFAPEDPSHNLPQQLDQTSESTNVILGGDGGISPTWPSVGLPR